MFSLPRSEVKAPSSPKPSFLSRRLSPVPGMLTGCEDCRKPAEARPWEMELPEQLRDLSPSRPEQFLDLVVSENPLDFLDLEAESP